MEIRELNKNNIDNKIINHAVRILKRGGVVVYPTDSSYGLGCDPENIKAVKKIYKIKNRPASEPFLMIASSAAMVAKYAKFSKAARAAAARRWPGPLTMVLEARPEIKLAKQMVKHGKIAFRVPKDKFLIKLVKKFKKPIISTSANMSGRAPIYDGKKLVKVFAGAKLKPDLIISVGALPSRQPSTIIEFKNGAKTLRPGPIKL
ncbi:threonylcarbamoyl-AMP synthase [Patescibacteria group bacterium]|nr:threonylcarbamoyl-AMP synthase [Patescibacteria group bacterium]MBU1921978.1 threonylcarbamoyl-AMP synthase [Patescibacteria group bacterium]